MSDETEVKEVAEPVVVDSPLPMDNSPVVSDAETSTEIVDPGGDQEWDLGGEFPEKTGESAGDRKPPVAPPDEQFDAELLGYAEQFGFDKDSFATPMQLTKAIASMHKILARPGGQEKQPAEVTQPLSATAPAHKPAPPAGDVPFEFDVPAGLLDPNQYDPEVVTFAKSVKSLNEHVQGKLSEVAQLRGLIGEMLHGVASQNAERYYDEVDNLFATDEAMAETFGHGNRHAMGDSPQLNARRAIIEQMEVARGIYAQQGKSAPATKQLYAIAKGILHSDKTQQIARRQIAERVRDAKGKFTAPPVHQRKGELPPGRDRAVAVLAKHMRDNPIFNTNVDTGLE